ncbi:MAG: hypothetical protein U9N34_11060, partial [Candidatus Cloacimonadota bacterium]|nr:hypothetical protein [Candidatus Cloacimonadota bacterium]
MKIIVILSSKYSKEQRFVLYHWLELWNNFEVTYKTDNIKDVVIKMKNIEFRFKSIFFEKMNKLGIVQKLFNKIQTINYRSYVAKSFSNSNEILHKKDNGKVVINADLIGTAFYFMSDFQSLINNQYDRFGRISANKSPNKKLISRPIVNELFELFKSIVEDYVPEVKWKKHGFKILPSHDVDHPFEIYKLDKRHFVKNLVGDVVIRRKNLLKRLSQYFYNNRELNDRYNTFKWILNQEKNHEAIFYFFAGNFNINNPDYKIGAKHIMNIVDIIRKEGKEIGIHLGLGSSTDSLIALKERKNIQSQNIDVCKNRFHYLSFNNPKSIDILENIGIKEDSTMSFFDEAGFRTGCCYKHYLWNFAEQEMSSVLENPLVFMEGTILDDSSTYEEAERQINILKTEV